jgi:hypothetical protein
MSPTTRTITTALALLAIAAPAATAMPSRDAVRTPTPVDASAAPQRDRRGLDVRDAARIQQHGDNVFTGGVRAPDWLAPDVQDTATAVSTNVAESTRDAPTGDRRFDWTSAGAGIALLVIALASAATLTRRSRPAVH